MPRGRCREGDAARALPRGRCLEDVASKPRMLETPYASNSWALGPWARPKKHILGGDGDGGGRIPHPGQTPSHHAGISYPVRVPPLTPINLYLLWDLWSRRTSQIFLSEIRWEKGEIWIRDPTYSGIEVKTRNFKSRPVFWWGSGLGQSLDIIKKMR